MHAHHKQKCSGAKKQLHRRHFIPNRSKQLSHRLPCVTQENFLVAHAFFSGNLISVATLVQEPFINARYILHRAAFHQKSLAKALHLQHKPFTPEGSYTTNTCFHQKLYSTCLLHQKPFPPHTFYIRNFLHTSKAYHPKRNTKTHKQRNQTVLGRDSKPYERSTLVRGKKT